MKRKNEITLLALLMEIGNLPAGSTDKNAVKLATSLLDRFGNLELLFKADLDQLRDLVDMNETRLKLIQAIGTVLKGRERDASICSSSAAMDWFRDLQSRDQEIVVAAFLNGKNCLIAKEEIFKGTLHCSQARPREILRAALKTNASKIIIAHNHPCQSPEPSEEDLKFTVLMEWAGQTIGIPLVDHIIISSHGQYFSFADARLLKKQKYH